MTRQLAIAACLLLTACGGGDEAAVTANNNVALEAGALESAAAETLPIALKADESETASAEPDAPAPAPHETEDEAADTAIIPAALHGRWGLTAADCTSTRGDAKGLLTIGEDTLGFYESRATLGRVVERDRSRIVADFAFTGEGQEWQRRQILDGKDDGQTLIRREGGADAMPGPLRYRRCEERS